MGCWTKVSPYLEGHLVCDQDFLLLAFDKSMSSAKQQMLFWSTRVFYLPGTHHKDTSLH